MTAGLRRRCPRCGTVARISPCPTCHPADERARDRRRYRGSSTARGYGTAHRKRRAELLPAALGTRCPLALPVCDGMMTDPRRMDLHHSRPADRLAGLPGDVIVCSPCNRSYGDGRGFPDQRRAPGPRAAAELRDTHPVQLTLPGIA